MSNNTRGPLTCQVTTTFCSVVSKVYYAILIKDATICLFLKKSSSSVVVIVAKRKKRDFYKAIANNDFHEEKNVVCVITRKQPPICTKCKLHIYIRSSWSTSFVFNVFLSLIINKF